MKSRLAIAITLWGWLLFISWLSYDYIEYRDRWIIHIFEPESRYEIHSFYVLIFLVPFIYTFLGYLVNEREKLLKKVKESEGKYRELSLHDELTKLCNRRGFYFLAEQQINIVNRTKQRLVLMYIDVDNVKLINDTWGHQEGDKALITTANILRNHVRKSDIIARLAGDEFVALIVETIEALPEIITTRLEESCQSLNKEGTHKFKLSLSVGFTYYDPVSPCSIDELLDLADRKMYEIKKRKGAKREK